MCLAAFLILNRSEGYNVRSFRGCLLDFLLRLLRIRAELPKRFHRAALLSTPRDELSIELSGGALEDLDLGLLLRNPEPGKSAGGLIIRPRYLPCSALPTQIHGGAAAPRSLRRCVQKHEYTRRQ